MSKIQRGWIHNIVWYWYQESTPSTGTPLVFTYCKQIRWGFHFLLCQCNAKPRYNGKISYLFNDRHSQRASYLQDSLDAVHVCWRAPGAVLQRRQWVQWPCLVCTRNASGTVVGHALRVMTRTLWYFFWGMEEKLSAWLLEEERMGMDWKYHLLITSVGERSWLTDFSIF